MKNAGTREVKNVTTTPPAENESIKEIVISTTIDVDKVVRARVVLVKQFILMSKRVSLISDKVTNKIVKLYLLILHSIRFAVKNKS